MAVTGSTNRSPEERLSEVRDLITEHGSVRIDQLATDLGVSEMTIRRDLDELHVLGLALRVRGGAIAVGPEPWESRHSHNAPAKLEIASKLISVVPRVGVIALDASTTLFWLAAEIPDADDLVVVTNGWDTFHAINGKPGVSALVTGGTEEPRTGSLVGPMAVRAAQGMLYDVFFCSAAGVDADLGASEASLAETEVKRAFGQASERVVVAVDHGKLEARAQALVFDFDVIDLMVTDLDPGDRRLDRYRDVVELM